MIRINEKARKGTVATFSPVTHRFVVIFQSHGSFQRAAEVFSRVASAVWLGRRWVALAALLFATACSRTPQTTQALSAGDGWHQFQGTWTAAGSRIRIPLGDGRRASTAKFEGSLVLAGTSRPLLDSARSRLCSTTPPLAWLAGRCGPMIAVTRYSAKSPGTATRQAITLLGDSLGVRGATQAPPAITNSPGAL